MPPMPMRVKKLPLTAARKVRTANRREPQERVRRARRAHAVAGEQQQREREQRQHLQRAPRRCSPKTSST